MKSFGVFVFALVVHFIFSKVGLLFSIPFGFASSIWPAAGVTLGLYLLFGRGVLFGSLFGYILAVSTDGLTWQVADLQSLQVPLALGLASVMQLIVTKLLIHRFVTLPVESANLRSIVKFLFFIGPLSCLTASAIGATVLGVVANLTIEQTLFTWAIWWVGDFTGVVFFTPLVLFLRTNAYVEAPAQPLKIVGSNLVVFAFISLLFAFSSAKYKNQNQQQFDQKVAVLIKQFENVQTTIEGQLLALSGLIQASSDVTRKDFANFTNKINDNTVQLRALAWMPKVNDQTRAAFEQAVADEGFTDFSIKYLGANGFKASPVGEYYLPILYTEPLESNRAAVGLDLNTHPSVKDSVHLAIKTNDFIVTPTLPLVQQQDKYTGVIVYYPVFETDAPNTRSTQYLLGLVEAVFELDVVLQNLPASQQSEFAFEFAYGDGNVYRSPGFSESALFSHQVVVEVFDKKGSLRFSSLTPFEDKLVDWASWLVVIGGTLIGVVSIIFLYSLTSFSANLALQVEKKTKDLKRTNDELALANKAKTMFLANMSHEYRTPLNAIIGFTEIAKRQVSEAKAIEYFDKIESSSKVMLNIVNDVLDISKIQTNEFELENAPFQPESAINEVADMLRMSAQTKGLELLIDVNEIADIWVKGDKARFKQIIINILSNAIKFTQEGQVQLVASYNMRALDSYQLELVFTDTGVGIEPSKQATIFKPFEQASEQSNRSFGGTGLGLSIVTELCHLMSGDIEVESKLGEGSKFKVRVMFSKCEKPAEVVSEHASVAHVDFSRLKVLVVEDNKINQEVARIQLESLGAVVDVCDDGQACLDYLQQQIPDLILMDLQMPVLDGFMTSKVIIEDPRLKHIPIIILSASVTNEDKARASELGINSYITKPFVQAELAEVLTETLKNC